MGEKKGLTGVQIIDLCGQSLCMAEASDRMFWPGAPPSCVCPAHKAKAQAIAKAMGFELGFVSIGGRSDG